MCYILKQFVDDSVFLLFFYMVNPLTILKTCLFLSVIFFFASSSFFIIRLTSCLEEKVENQKIWKIVDVASEDSSHVIKEVSKIAETISKTLSEVLHSYDQGLLGDIVIVILFSVGLFLILTIVSLVKYIFSPIIQLCIH